MDKLQILREFILLSGISIIAWAEPPPQMPSIHDFESPRERQTIPQLPPLQREEVPMGPPTMIPPPAFSPRSLFPKQELAIVRVASDFCKSPNGSKEKSEGERQLSEFAAMASRGYAMQKFLLERERRENGITTYFLLEAQRALEIKDAVEEAASTIEFQCPESNLHTKLLAEFAKNRDNDPMVKLFKENNDPAVILSKLEAQSKKQAVLKEFFEYFGIYVPEPKALKIGKNRVNNPPPQTSELSSRLRSREIPSVIRRVR